ncbi:carboxy terminal-processing peptidase [Abyssalbus ytuae]|uniref:Carboxy terminal-processing peptidase n=1 Tax=Abyssalbus ytuae TaxID=2926907 RepID=A0A9E7D0T6_9FLAO|nr:carboxy terminal-processing peptidase [Abyssalbus ytuae]UOB18715.1 carboxy terminal-processing peptidase [Abyssalbus ytuae]
MKRNFVYLLVVIMVSVASCSFTNKSFNNPDKDKLLVELISYVLDKWHFNSKDLDDEFSKNVYEDYIEVLDPLKRYFHKSDIKEFEKYRYAIDDQIKTSEVTFFNLTYERLMKRMEEAQDIYKEVLKTPFNYSVNESINTDYEKQPYASNRKELLERWRKQLKFSTISRFMEANEEEDEKLAEDSSYIRKPMDSIELKTREATLKAIEEYFNATKDIERKDWFSFYLNSIVEEFDPHTYYFAPEDKERFDMRFSGKFEGIGARLQKRNDNIKIVEIISGGPAWRGKKVEVGDEILKVAQGDDIAVDVVGMKLDDAVKLIKGPKGTEVRLTVKRVDGTIEEVSIVRDVVELEESYAKSSFVEKNGKKFGVINLPQFYMDFNDYKNGRNASDDVAKEIERLKEVGMEGLVLDLRDNGGGSLKTVVDMAGLFIEKGPVVQVKTTGNGREVLEDEDERIQWDGPLVILVNELSASASEILAAAMQDYKRAIVLGSKQTYGKGTVQNILDLNNVVRNNEHGDLGSIKITTQKFYRIDGGSTQLEGVKSDVIVPDRYSFINIGEKDQENPLPWDKISPAEYKTWDGYIDYDETIQKSKDRMASSDQLKLIEQNALWIKEQQEDDEYPLNYQAFIKEQEMDEEISKKFKAITDYHNNLSFESLPYELKLMGKDSVLKEKRERWHEELSKDVYVEEAINVLEDLQLSNIKRQKLASIKG